MSNEDGVKTVSEQIDEMLKVGFVEPEVEPPAEEPPIEDPPVEEPPIEEPPVEPPVVEPPAEPPVVEPPEELPAIDDLETIRKENENLRKRIEEMSAPKSTEPSAEPEPAPEPKLDEIDFIGDADMDEITRDPKEFNKLLNKVFAQGINTSRTVLGEGVLRSIPDIVKTNVATVISLRESSEQFYKENKDLEPFKKVVSNVFEEIAAKNPDKKFSEILDDVGKEARKRLELYKEAIKPDLKPDPKSPVLPKIKGQHRGPSIKPDISPMQAEIDAMNEAQF